MTSLQHHSHLLKHHTTSSVGTGSNNNNGNALNVSLNNSTNNISPVMQRKIESTAAASAAFNRYSSGSANGVGGNNGGADFDTTSIASVSESSHWSGGAGDDLDNIALVNGSDCMSTMENKDWSTYIKMAKNGYNSSDEDNNNTNNGEEEESGDDEDYFDDSNEEQERDHSKQKPQSLKTVNKMPNTRKMVEKTLSKTSNSTSKSSSKSSIASRKNSENNSKNDINCKTTANNNLSKHQHSTNKKLNKENLSATDLGESGNGYKGKRGVVASSSANTNFEPISNNNKKIKKKDSFEGGNNNNKPNENDNVDNGIKHTNRQNSLSDEESTNNNICNKNNNNTNTVFEKDHQLNTRKYKVGGKSSSIETNENECAGNEEAQAGEESDEVDEIESDDECENEEDVDDESDEVDNEDDGGSDEDDDDESDEDDLDDDDIWTIKPKLYIYYEKQFKTMEPNLNGFIIGTVAKPFFERSKLPLNELSKIWELSDVTKDGALSFAEFCTAMHLVVLRVRNFELPNELPEKLQPYAPLIDFNNEAPTKLATNSNEDSILNISDAEDMVGSPSQNSSRLVPGGPTGGESLVQFSLKPQIPNDIQIVHPVPLRYNQTTQHQQTTSVPEPPPRHSRSSSLGTITDPQGTSQPIPSVPTNQQTPQKLTNNSTPGPAQLNSTNQRSEQLPISAVTNVNTPKILQQQPVVPPRITSPPPVYHQQHEQQHQQVHSGALLPPPPPPPPLTHHQINQHHNRLHQHMTTPVVGNGSGQSTTSVVRAPPPPPTGGSGQSTEEIGRSIERLVDQMNSLNVERLKRISETTTHAAKQHHQSVAASSSTSSTNSNLDADALALSIRAQTEQNLLLRRVFAELEKELRALTENRIALEIKLDYLNTATTQQSTTTINNNNQPSSNIAIIPSTPAASLTTTTTSTAGGTPNITNSNLSSTNNVTSSSSNNNNANNPNPQNSNSVISSSSGISAANTTTPSVKTTQNSLVHTKINI